MLTFTAGWALSSTVHMAFAGRAWTAVFNFALFVLQALLAAAVYEQETEQ